jgi:hypothetical protein
MAKEMYDRRVVKSQAVAAAMIPMNRSAFNYRYNRRNFKENKNNNPLMHLKKTLVLKGA